MKKIATYFLVIVLSIEFFSLHQVAKLPVLYQHFNEHKQRDRNVSMLEFLAMHYWGNDVNDNDEQRDAQLPFKQETSNIVTGAFCTPVKIFTVQYDIDYQEIDFPLTSSHLLPDPKMSSLFRPPRV